MILPQLSHFCLSYHIFTYQSNLMQCTSALVDKYNCSEIVHHCGIFASLKFKRNTYFFNFCRLFAVLLRFRFLATSAGRTDAKENQPGISHLKPLIFLQKGHLYCFRFSLYRDGSETFCSLPRQITFDYASS